MDLLIYASLILLLIPVLLFLFTRERKKKSAPINLAFFHPYCMSGGGGERVLWAMIKAFQDRYAEKVNLFVYTGDNEADCEHFEHHVKERFSIVIPEPKNVQFVHVKGRWLLEASSWRVGTMFGQSFGSVLFALNAVMKFVPDVMVDTTGHAFILPIFRLLGCQVAAYIHYPTISRNMIERVSRKEEMYNNSDKIAGNVVLSSIKLIYYKLFALAYSKVLCVSDFTMVNSSWTKSHIDSFLNSSQTTRLIYPPCNVEKFKTAVASNNDDKGSLQIVSIGQFRPEKNHRLQLRILSEVMNLLELGSGGMVKLVLIGSDRNGKDSPLIDKLKAYAKELSVEDHVQFMINQPIQVLLDTINSSQVAIHTMKDEHFGIALVECMAAGLIMIGHNSGGPKMDILKKVGNGDDIPGFLCSTAEEYASVIADINLMDLGKRNKIRKAAMKRADEYSDSVFQKSVIEAFEEFIMPDI